MRFLPIRVLLGQVRFIGIKFIGIVIWNTLLLVSSSWVAFRNQDVTLGSTRSGCAELIVNIALPIKQRGIGTPSGRRGDAGAWQAATSLF